jgi:hypothetical protein
MNQVKPKMSGKPPKPQNLDSFLAEAEATPQPSQPEKQPEVKIIELPWNSDHVRQDVIKSINLRLPEDYILKLQFISQKTYKSQQMLVREALLPFIDEEINRILKQ